MGFEIENMKLCLDLTLKSKIEENITSLVFGYTVYKIFMLLFKLEIFLCYHGICIYNEAST